jgi:hypothetical protein
VTSKPADIIVQGAFAVRAAGEEVEAVVAADPLGVESALLEDGTHDPFVDIDEGRAHSGPSAGLMQSKRDHLSGFRGVVDSLAADKDEERLLLGARRFFAAEDLEEVMEELGDR